MPTFSCWNDSVIFSLYNSPLQYKDILQLMLDASEDTSDQIDLTSTTTGCPVHQSSIGSDGKRYKLTDKDLVSLAVSFLGAGYETTANTISYTSYLLALNPDIQEKLQSEIDNYFEEKPVSSILIR